MYGFCPSGLACRYGSSHINPAGASITNSDLYQPDLGPNKIMNAIPRTLQEQLRKKKIPFPRSDVYLKSVKSSSDNANNNPVTTGVAIATEVPTATKDTIATSDEPPMEANVKLKEESTSSTSEHQALNEMGTVDPILPLGPVPDGDIDPILPRPLLGPVPDGDINPILPRPLLGPVPDGDTIKLKPEEKKRIDFRDKLYLAPLTTVSQY